MKLNYDEIKQLLRTRLKEGRYYHSLCVADAAVSIAKIYGAAQDKAYLAGLVHDIMRNETEEELLRYMKKNNIILSDVEMKAPVLWHSILGADYIKKNLYIVDEDIVNAVRYHTTGRAGMSLLEQVIFLADCSSADRNYSDVERIRNIIKTDINMAMYEVLDFTVNDLKKKCIIVHPDTEAAYAEFIRFKC